MREIKSIFDLAITRIAIILNAVLIIAKISRYSFSLYWFNLAYVLIGLLLVPVTFAIVVMRRRTLKHKWMFPFVQLPMFLYFLALSLCTVFILPIMFIIHDIGQQKTIQCLTAPDRSYTLTVKYNQHNMFIHGQGDYTIEKSTRWLPFLERAIYEVPVSDLWATDTLFIRWVAPNTIVIIENDDTLKVD